MSEQSGNRFANYPKPDQWEGNDVTSNPTKYQTGVESGGEGGDPTSGEIASPAKENQYKTDTLHPKKSQ